MRLHTYLFILMLPSWAIGQTGHDLEIKHYRDSINQRFGDPELSILEEKDIPDFKYLEFYPNSADYLVKADFEPIEDGEPFEMKTSTERLPVYRPYGKLSFELNGKQLSLIAYQNVKHAQNEEYKNHLFVPFTDETNGNETYGGGRYMDLDLSKITDYAMIDFNKCYNPYCAYNGKYSCPIPPKENALKTKIEAGVKAFDH